MTPIDTLYYQWAVDDETKKTPTIFEDIETVEEAEKVDDLLVVHAELVSDLIEAEVSHRSVLDDFIARAQDDAELAGIENAQLAEAIADMDEVKESEAGVTTATNRLNMFQENFVAVLAGVE